MKTIDVILTMVAELNEEEKKTVRVPHYYKHNGEMKRRSYDETVHTERYNELMKQIGEAEVFQCACCGEMCSWFDLEEDCCDFENGKYFCSRCYDEE